MTATYILGWDPAAFFDRVASACFRAAVLVPDSSPDEDLATELVSIAEGAALMSRVAQTLTPTAPGAGATNLAPGAHQNP